jgi:predicted small metal-binding protein
VSASLLPAYPERLPAAALTAPVTGWRISKSRERRTMARKYVDCREVPSEMNCTVGIAADSEEELLEAAVQHAVAVHSHEDTEELRSMIRQSIKETEAAAV